MSAFAAGPAEEQLRYQINWPTGLSLGEAQLSASRDGGRWNLAFQLEAAIPGFRVFDRYRSGVDEKYCAIESEKEFEHGSKKGKEKTVFSGGKAKRTTQGGGGSSEIAVPACAYDALGFLFFVREEVRRGRIPNALKLYFGSSYDVRVKFAGVETVKVSEAPMETDRLHVTVTGPASKVEFDVFLARDEARTPAMIRVPFALGTFSMEWVR